MAVGFLYIVGYLIDHIEPDTLPINLGLSIYILYYIDNVTIKLRENARLQAKCPSNKFEAQIAKCCPGIQKE